MSESLTYNERLISYFSNKVQHPCVLTLFRKCIYLFIIINALILLPIADQIWSPEAYIVHHNPFQPKLLKVLNIMSHPHMNEFYMFFIAAQLVFSIFGLMGKFPRISALIVWFTTVNLYYCAQPLQTGGSNLLILFLFYMMFVDEKAQSTLNITITNFAFLACKIQLCVLYFVSAVYKLYGTHWLDGSAIYYVLNIDTYTTPIIKNVINSCSWLSLPLTWFTLGFQLLFPIFVWIKKLKPLTLKLGIILHVCIGLIMGLMDFSVIMIIAYVLFFSDERSKNLLNNFPFNKLRSA